MAKPRNRHNIHNVQSESLQAIASAPSARQSLTIRTPHQIRVQGIIAFLAHPPAASNAPVMLCTLMTDAQTGRHLFDSFSVQARLGVRLKLALYPMLRRVDQTRLVPIRTAAAFPVLSALVAELGTTGAGHVVASLPVTMNSFHPLQVS
jgi:hypothetical protein